MKKLARRAQLFHGMHVTMDPQWQSELNKAGISDNDDWLSLTGELVASGGATKCYRLQLDNGETVYFKRYVYRRRHLQFWMLPSKPLLEVSGYQTLKNIGLPAPEVIAYGEKRQYGDLRAAFIITREIPDTQNLEDYARNVWVYLPAAQRKQIFQHIAPQVIDMAKTIHKNHFYHYDLKWRNILIQGAPENSKIVFIDCPRSRVSYLRPLRGQEMDLSGLARIAMYYFRRSEQLRLLVQYSGSREQAKKLFRRIQRRLQSRYPKDPRPEEIDYKLI